MKLELSNLDLSGVVWSDYRLAGGTPSYKQKDGWVKGWAVDTPQRNIIIVARHCGPAPQPPSNLVRFYASDGSTKTRLIVEMDVPVYSMGAQTLSGERHGGDIVVCRLDKEFPEWVKPYSFARKPKDNDRVVTITQRGLSEAKLRLNKDPWAFCFSRKDMLISGDSGLPWFIEEKGQWRVVSHSTKGLQGEGPLYSHPSIFPSLSKRIFALAKSKTQTP